MVLRIADTIKPAKRPRMNRMAVPSGTRRSGRKARSFQTKIGKYDSVRGRGRPTTAGSGASPAPWRAPSPCPNPHDQVGQDHEQKGRCVEPADDILLDPCISLIAPRTGSPRRTCRCIASASPMLRAFSEQARVDYPGRPGIRIEGRISPDRNRHGIDRPSERKNYGSAPHINARARQCIFVPSKAKATRG